MKNGIEVREEKKFALGAREAGWDRREDGGLGKELGKGRQGGRRENKHGWSKNCASAASKRYLHTPPSPYINTLATGMQISAARSFAGASVQLAHGPAAQGYEDSLLLLMDGISSLISAYVCHAEPHYYPFLPCASSGQVNTSQQSTAA